MVCEFQLFGFTTRETPGLPEKDKPLELQIYSGLRRKAFTARLSSACVSLLVEYSARNTRLFGRPSNTRLGILDFSAGLQILGSEYSTFRPTFEYSARNTRLFGRTSECRLAGTYCIFIWHEARDKGGMRGTYLPLIPRP